MAIPAFVINLNRRQDRWAAISEQLDRLGIQTARVEALDGEHATSADLAPFVSLDGWARERELDLASAACIVSHRSALARFLRETDASAALILEDDVKLASDLPTFLMAAQLALRGTRLLKLDVTRSGAPRRRSLGSSIGTIQRRNLHPIATWVPGAGAYLATREMAETIVRRCQGVTEPFDQFLFNLTISSLARELRPVLVQPALAVHQMEAFSSDIGPYRASAPRTAFVRRLASDLRKAPRRWRVVGQLMAGKTTRNVVRFADKL